MNNPRQQVPWQSPGLALQLTAPAPIPFGSFPVPLDTVQHILKYIKFQQRGHAAIGISTHATGRAISEQLVSSFFLGGSEQFNCPRLRYFPAEGKLRQSLLHLDEEHKSYGAGWFLLRQPKFKGTTNDKDFVKKAVVQSGEALYYAGRQPRKDREVVLAAVKENGFALAHADPELKMDREIVMAAVKESGWALAHANPELRKDQEIVMAAVKQHGGALRYADPELKKDREIVLAAVKESWWALEHADPELRKDGKVVLTAMQKDGHGQALEYADAELKKDRDFVQAAVKLYGEALLWAVPGLRKDREIVLAAAKQNALALEYADAETVRGLRAADLI